MNRSGTFVQNLKNSLSYQSFKPSPLPPHPLPLVDEVLDKKIKAFYLLCGQLNQISELIPNKSLFISMYVRKEALLSSQIEGTQATLDDILDPHIDRNMNLDTEEVVQYLKALNASNELSEELPISIRFISNVHKILLTSVRGTHKDPGQIRKTQNWIGPPGSQLKNARFIPPNVSDMHEALSDLEKFIHESSGMDPVIKIALIHYQFETIHPFLDGNGRMGRLLVSLLLKEYGLLKDDLVYISYYLKQNRYEYYDRLMDVRLKGHYEAWLLFFINGLNESAKHAIDSIHSILKLKKKDQSLITLHPSRNRKTVLKVYEYLLTHPIIDITKTSQALNLSYNAIANAVNVLEVLNILYQVEGHQRYRIFAYEPYLNILREGT